MIKGYDYHDCVEKCRIPKQVSGRAAKFGADLQQEYFAMCLDKTKTFNHIEHRFEVDPVAELRCHVMRKEINIMFLEKMQKEFTDSENNKKIWALTEE